MVLPLLLLLLFGAVEFGRAIITFTSVHTAAREGARYATTVGESATPGVLHYFDCDGIREAARAKATMLDLADSDIEVVYDGGPDPSSPSTPPPVFADCQGGAPPTEDGVPSGSRIVVRVETEFESPVPIISSFLGTLSIESEQARTLFKGEISG